jgi:hypothetical protein
VESNKIFLITSGAYSNDEITSDFGLLPTSFLPVGHKRLYELQLELISSFDGVKFITLPQNFFLTKRDKKLIERSNIKIHRTNPNLSLSQSILNFINDLNLDSLTSLYLLHGDTLFKEIDYEDNLIYYGNTDSFYKWGGIDDFCFKNDIEETINLKSVISGYFTLNNIPLLKKELNKSNSFVLALKEYSNVIPFKVKKTNDWLDFGHSNLYYKSKRNLNVTRSFNSTQIINNHIKKESANREKIKSEYDWFKQLPENLKMYTPAVWGFEKDDKSASYMIEFIGAATLQEKFVFGNLPDYSYYKIIDDIFAFINKEKMYSQNKFSPFEVKKSLKDLYVNKTEERINSFLNQVKFDADRTLIIDNKNYKPLTKFKDEIINELNKFLNNLHKDHKLSIMHGDLCFSNILFDSRSNSLKLIDPRGGLNNKFDSEDKIYGDFQYDIAKLGHSLIGNYDFIVSGFYNLSYDMDNYKFELGIEQEPRDNLIKYFYDKVDLIGVSKYFIKASITNLFLSMLPLHNEDKERQLALLINAYKFYYN